MYNARNTHLSYTLIYVLYAISYPMIYQYNTLQDIFTYVVAAKSTLSQTKHILNKINVYLVNIN